MYSPLARLMLCWIGVIVLVFTSSSTKQDLYIFPIVAALAALLAGLLDRAIEGEEPGHTATRWTWPVIAVSLVGFFVAMRALFGTGESQYYVRGAQLVSAVLLAGGLVLAVLWWRRKMLAAVLALGLTFVVANYILVLIGLPDFERFKPVAPLSAAALTRDPGARVIQYRVALPSMVWYLGRPVEEVLDAPVLQERLARPGETLVLLSAEDYEAVSTLAPTCIVDRRPLFDVKLRSVIDGTAMPEMLLISNRCD